MSELATREARPVRAWSWILVRCAAAIAAAAVARAQPVQESFEQVNVDGFGQIENVYAWSMQAWEDALYVGTFNDRTGGQIWRYDGTDWQPEVIEDVAATGTGGFRNMTVFQGDLYTGTLNVAFGAEVWRKRKSERDWAKVATGGFGNVESYSIRALYVHDGWLYVGTQNVGDLGPAQLWRSANGTDWELVTPDGFGDLDNSSVHTAATFGGHLYVGTRNIVTGAQIWRSADGLTFEPVVGPDGPVPGGFGRKATSVVYDLRAYRDRLYVGTGNKYGFQVFRTADGDTYQRIGRPGFGDRDNLFAWRFVEFGDRLWLGVMNQNVGQEGGGLWRATFGRFDWTELVGANGTVMGDGFGDVRNWGVRSFAVFRGELYIGTGQCWADDCQLFVTGCEVWRYLPDGG